MVHSAGSLGRRAAAQVQDGGSRVGGRRPIRPDPHTAAHLVSGRGCAAHRGGADHPCDYVNRDDLGHYALAILARPAVGGSTRSSKTGLRRYSISVSPPL